MTTAHLPRWAVPFTRKARYKSVYGGRGSSKTWTVARLIIAEAARTPLKVACCREVQSSIQESAKPALEGAIHALGLQRFFRITRWRIDAANGSRFFFHGLRHTREEIRGWEGVNRVWVEEAQRLSHEVARVLIPTIRTANSELYFTWNPQNRNDWVWERFVQHPRPDDIIRKVNFDQNPWFPEESEVERLYDQEYNPTLYPHIWLGEPDDQGADRRVLRYDTLLKCVEAYKQGLWAGVADSPRDGGLDIANSGGDRNAFVGRVGPVIKVVSRWTSDVVDDLKPTAERAIDLMGEIDAKRCWYDANGVGGPMGGELIRVASTMGRTVHRRRVLAGEKVKGPRRLFSYKLTNEQAFYNRGSQMGWNLLLRAQNTLRLLNGRDVNPQECLFIDPDCCVPPVSLEEFLSQLSQPMWKEASQDQIHIVKAQAGEPSPDMYDACYQAFGQDSISGLRARMDPMGE